MQHQPVRVMDGVFMLKVPLLISSMQRDSNSVTLSYLVQTGQGWLLVDTGYNDPGAFAEMERQFKMLNVAMEQVRWIFLTHYHPDHSGMAQRIKEIAHARVIMHREDWEILRGMVGSTKTWNLDGLVEWARSLGVPQIELQRFYDMASFGRMLFPAGLQPDIILQGENEEVVSSQFRAILTPGHSPGHICLHDRTRRVLFSGDHVLPGITPHISPSHLTSYNQLGQYLSSLRRIRSLDVDRVLPAHEEPIPDLARRVDEILDHHEQRLEEVIAGLANQPLSPWDLASHVHWDVGTWDQMDATNRVLAVRETLAHLEYLESCGKASRLTNPECSIYQLVSRRPE